MIKNTVLFFLLLAMSVVTAKAQNKSGEMIFKAMQDELDRSMQELKSPDNIRPFFLEYTISEGQVFRYKASLGSLIEQSESPKLGSFNVRIMAGNYHRTNAPQYRKQRISPNPPATTIEEDYGQLRRDLWRQTDLLFKSAAEELKVKSNLIKQGVISPEDTLLDDYSRVKPMVHVEANGYSVINNEKIKKITQELSAVFNDYPMIEQSDVQSMASTNMMYVLNSEKSKYTIPNGAIRFNINVSTRSGKKQISDNMKIAASSEDDLPSLEKMKGQVKAFADQFVQLLKSQDVVEDYSGPVLLENEAVGDLFNSELFSSYAVFASRENGPNQTSTSLQDKMNAKVMDNQLTVKFLPFLTEFNNQRLIGHFGMDSEGVIPEKELTIIENGILKNVVANRMPTKYSKTSSGYFRTGALPMIYVANMSPGVVDISTSKGLPADSLKQRLIRSAKENGLKYAYIIRRVSVGMIMNQFGSQVAMMPTKMYIVNVENGEETLVRGGDLRNLKKGSLKSVLGASDKKFVYNILDGYDIPVSIICPTAILLPDVEITIKKEMPLPQRYVENPLSDKS